MHHSPIQPRLRDKAQKEEKPIYSNPVQLDKGKTEKVKKGKSNGRLVNKE